MNDTDFNFIQSFTYTIERPAGMSDADWQRFCEPKPKVKQPVPASSPGDQEEFLALLDSWGVPYEDNGTSIRITRKADAPDSETSVVQGYNEFYTEWSFDAEGRFIEVGIWE